MFGGAVRVANRRRTGSFFSFSSAPMCRLKRRCRSERQGKHRLPAEWNERSGQFTGLLRRVSRRDAFYAPHGVCFHSFVAVFVSFQVVKSWIRRVGGSLYRVMSLPTKYGQPRLLRQLAALRNHFNIPIEESVSLQAPAKHNSPRPKHGSCFAIWSGKDPGSAEWDPAVEIFLEKIQEIRKSTIRVSGPRGGLPQGHER